MHLEVRTNVNGVGTRRYYFHVKLINMYLCINVLGTVDSMIIRSLLFGMKGHMIKKITTRITRQL